MEAAVGWGDTAPVFLLLLVIVVDALIGAFPGFRVILDAPLTAVRAITRWFDGKLNREHRGGEARRMRGLIAVLIIAALAWFVGLLVSGAARAVPQGWIIEMAGLLMVLRYGDCISRMQKGWRLLAGKNNQETRLTAGPLIRPLIRYDAQNLDHFGLARAAIEGGMARFCDRFLATVFSVFLSVVL
jgi:cobalamin biosynthesis protein CobD/CbiB